MKKIDVIKHFGNSVRKTAEALGLSTAAIYAWPDILTDRIERRVKLIIKKPLYNRPPVER